MTDLVIGIERLTALAFVATGLSHIAAPRHWARFFIAMRDNSPVPGFLNAYVHAPLGLLIVAFHWVWDWPGIAVTLVGCALTLKGLLYFTFPGLALRSMTHVREDRPWQFRLPGFAALAFGIWIGWLILGSEP